MRRLDREAAKREVHRVGRLGQPALRALVEHRLHRRNGERIAAAEKQKVVVYMNSRAFATGHGDTIDDLLKELEWQVAEREREACAKLAGPHLGGEIAAAIRARGET